ncbi:cyclic nucleotide-binding domain-containing thioredoxin-disulfide reductase [Sphingomonas sp. LM7]|uniref:FAD-dependent oxidoreductase n=1 Tax=Sphingomonas sp. LM7 TaxID=1938607 RepID=UPI0009839E95|nr:cyclic nucleotide-binding domain-containing thioredoxin-disulfide reductase [Sphingomonas sp. LM7]AQR73998.1 cation tolerance protein CutA [Sphingomonas sp. LM7]
MGHDSPAQRPDPSDPYLREAQTFPLLSAEMLARVAAFGGEEMFAHGALLFRRGDRSVDFFVCLEGGIEILDADVRGRETAVHVHVPRQFSGELDLFNDRTILVTARARGETRVLRVGRAEFRRMMAAEPDIGEIIMRAFILRRVGMLLHGTAGVALVGPGHASDTARIETFLSRNALPHRRIDTETDADAAGFLECFALTDADLPVVVAEGRALRNPSNAQLADALGLASAVDPDHVHDVAVVGAGPAGLASAVYAASEGLDTIVIESIAPGGQAGTSSKIENYLGFPTGISGQALAGRAQVQAQKFGARLLVSRSASGIDCDNRPYTIQLDDGATLKAHSVVVATGARYRKLDLPRYAELEGNGIYYAATAMEAGLCANQTAVVIGGGNSAGQAAIYLSRTAGHVHMLVRGPGLAATMSRYLIERIEAADKITLHPFSEVTGLEGDKHLNALSWADRRSGESQRHAVGALFVMIGAQPNTDWLDGCIDLDAAGFVTTGSGETFFCSSTPGIFAVGDVRSGSVKRVASGVGEGSVVVSAIHRYLESREQ